LSLSNTHDIQLYIICFGNQGYYLGITEDSGRDNQDTINFLPSTVYNIAVVHGQASKQKYRSPFLSLRASRGWLPLWVIRSLKK
jgi:hypothetical protein